MLLCYHLFFWGHFGWEEQIFMVPSSCLKGCPLYSIMTSFKVVVLQPPSFMMAAVELKFCHQVMPLGHGSGAVENREHSGLALGEEKTPVSKCAYQLVTVDEEQDTIRGGVSNYNALVFPLASCILPFVFPQWASSYCCQSYSQAVHVATVVTACAHAFPLRCLCWHVSVFYFFLFGSWSLSLFTQAWGSSPQRSLPMGPEHG